MADTYENYVGGEWTDSSTGETFENRNPADPDDVIGTFPDSAGEDAETAVAAANDAAAEWAAMPGPERGSILREAAKILDDRYDELVELLVREEGKTPAEAGEVQRAIDIFYYYAEKARDLGGDRKRSSAADTDLYTVQEPLGVVGLITPWNYPIAIPAWKGAPALAAGNAVVIKPAPEAPAVAHEIAKALDEAGLPDGVLNVVNGYADPAATLVGHDDVDAISFTGSAEVGKQIYRDATAAGQRAQTEMGGKNPTVVTDSAD
ncbi:aldehyde dehydrogenase family protein, partial [Halarchaeum acidiphilum]